MNRFPRRIGPLLIAGLVALSFACASSKGPGAEPRQLLFWRITHPTQPGVMHLLGSIHVGRQPVGALDPGIERAFDEAGVLVVETNLGPAEELVLQQLLLVRALLPEGTLLADEIAPDTYADVQAALPTVGLPAGSLDRFRPWFVGLTLTVQKLQQLGYRGEFGIDRYFMVRARGRKPIGSLETLEAQVALFADATPELQELSLAQTLGSFDDMSDEIGEALLAWRNGDTETLLRFFREQYDREPRLEPFYERLYTARNREMAQKLADVMQRDETWFVVVGAGHVAGPEGIPAQLAGAGLRVERVAPDPDAPAFVAATPLDVALFQRTFAEFQAAVSERDGMRAASFTNRATALYYERVRRVALGASREQLEGLAPSDKLQVLALRTLGAEALEAVQGHAVYALAVEGGFVQSDPAITLRDPIPYGHFAEVQTVLAGQPSPLRFRFERESEVWRLDVPSTLAVFDHIIRQGAAASGRSVDEVVMAALAQTLGEPPSDTLWEPLRPPETPAEPPAPPGG